MPEIDVVISEDQTLIRTELPPIPGLKDLTPAQVQELIRQDKLRALREYRNRLLAECDWTQCGDVLQSVQDSWKPYRQALRDITAGYSSLDEAVFPEKPE